MKNLILTLTLLLCASAALGRMGPVTCGGGQSGSPSCTSSNDGSIEVISTTTGGGARTISSTSWRAQSFTNANAFSATCVVIRLSDTGGDVGNFVLQLRSDNSNVPSSTVLASASLAATSIGATESNIEICFSTPASGLSASTKYWIVGGADAGGFTMHRDTGNPYANGGESLSSNGGSTWGAETATNDYTMTIYGCEP